MARNADRLTALDGTFLELEDADSCAHMHIGAIMVFGPRPDGAGAPALDEVRTHLDSRLGLLPRYRCRLDGPDAGSLTWRHWVPDEHFDIARHVLATSLPAPGGWEELLEWSGDYFSARLDRTMPLWQVMVVDGLGDGHWAVVTKTHHSMVDGVGSVDAVHLLFDGLGDTAASAPAADGDGHHDGRGGLGPLGPFVHGVGAGLRAIAHPADLTRRAEAMGELLVREEVIAAPDTSINSPIGPRRLLRAVSVDFTEVRWVKAELGGTVNDIALAGAAAGLRALLLARGEEPPARGLRAMVPMNVRRGGEQLGNRVSSLFVDLPVAEPDPLARYDEIRAATAAVKASVQPLGTDSLLRVAELAPPALHHFIARSLWAKRLFNVTITNVPGPRVQLSAFGAPLKTVWPLVPLASEHAVGIAIVSYEGKLMFGICADRDSTPDVDVLAAGIASGLADLERVVLARGVERDEQGVPQHT